MPQQSVAAGLCEVQRREQQVVISRFMFIQQQFYITVGGSIGQLCDYGAADFMLFLGVWCGL
jgi:hypothetical protein